MAANRVRIDDEWVVVLESAAITQPNTTERAVVRTHALY
jgi:hypothetical protein